MRKPSFGRLLIIGCLLTLAALLPVLPVKGQIGEVIPSGENGNRKVKGSAAPVRVFGSQTIVYGAGSLLVRTPDGAYMTCQSFGLTPGEAVTAWWVIFNNPRACATSPCTLDDLANPDVQASGLNATGRVVGADGTAEFGAFRAVGDTTLALFGPGLLNPFKAEIHLVVRSHGPAILDNPQILREQLTLFNGGCPPNTCADLQVSVHQP